jgi:hypothetical protein
MVVEAAELEIFEDGLGGEFWRGAGKYSVFFITHSLQVTYDFIASRKTRISHLHGGWAKF